MKVHVSLRAEDLGNIAQGRWRGKTSNPYATVKFPDDGGGMQTIVGKTEVLLSNLDPRWTEVFTIERNSSHTPLRITIFDSRNPPPPPFSAHTHESVTSKSIRSLEHRHSISDPMMGEVDVEASEILNMDGQEKKLDLKQGGRIYVHITEDVDPNNQNTGSRASVETIFSCHLRGLDFENIESGCLGLGAIDPYFELSKKYCHSSSGITRWYCIYRSEHLPNIINPYWQPFKIELEKLCHGNLQHELRLVVMDKQAGRLHDRFIGECEMNVRFLMDCVTKGGNANREDAFDILNEEMETTGKVVVLKADLEI